MHYLPHVPVFFLKIPLHTDNPSFGVSPRRKRMILIALFVSGAIMENRFVRITANNKPFKHFDT